MTLQQLGPQDAQFLYVQTPGNQTHTTFVLIYDQSTAPDGKVRFKDILSFVESRLDQSPVFRRKLHRLPLDFDHPYWVEDEAFDLEAHISHTRLPEPGDWRQFCILVSRHHSRPMDMSRPLWDMMVVEGLDAMEGYPKGCFAVLCRVHHCTIDGGSGMQLFFALSDMTADGKPVLPPAERAPDHGREPTLAEAWNRAATSNVTSPVKLANSLARFAPAMFDMAQKNVRGDDAEESGVPHTRFNETITPHKVFEALNVPLDDVKAIKNKVPGATINDAVLAVCGGALRTYLTEHHELPDTSLIGWVPINVRKKGEESKANNQISAMTVQIGTNIADPMARLAAVSARTADAKASKSGMGARILTDLSQQVPGLTMAALARLVASEKLSPKVANAFISNVPGAPMPVYFAGAKCVNTFGLAPLSNGMALMIVASSYVGSLTIGITSDRKVMPDIAFFRECIQKSFDELLAAPAPDPDAKLPELEEGPEPAKAERSKSAQPRQSRVKEINP